MPTTRHIFLAAAVLCASSAAYGQSAPQNPEAEFSALLQETAGLRVYNNIIERQIANQEEDLREIEVAISQVPNLERQIPPLLTRIVDGLERFIELDLPFLLEERTESLAELQTLLESTTANDAEKFRRVMEAWQIENEYGRTYEAYIQQLDIDGATREVDILRLGRVGLVYQTTDDEGETGVWDPRTEQWVPLGSQHRNSVRQALRMARNQVAPDIVLVPITPPQN